MNDLLGRQGIIKVSLDLIKQNPEGIMEVFKDILVTDVKFEYPETLHYKGLSKYFDYIKQGEQPPFYDVKIINLDGIIKKIEFERLKE